MDSSAEKFPTRWPVVVCLCGSTRHKEQYLQAARDEELAGRIVLSVGSFPHSDGVAMSAEEKALVDELHLRKIDLSDEILVIDHGGYVGDSTRREISHAKNTGKKVRYFTEEAYGK